MPTYAVLGAQWGDEDKSKIVYIHPHIWHTDCERLMTRRIPCPPKYKIP